MPLSLSSSDVKVIAGIAVVIAGLAVVIAGIFTKDVSIITLGAGLLGAPGVVSASRGLETSATDNDGKVE